MIHFSAFGRTCFRNLLQIRPVTTTGTASFTLTTKRRHSKMPLHHLMIGTWTPPGAIFTVQFDDEALTLKLVKRTAIPEDEPISWMAFDVRLAQSG